MNDSIQKSDIFELLRQHGFCRNSRNDLEYIRAKTLYDEQHLADRFDRDLFISAIAEYLDF